MWCCACSNGVSKQRSTARPLESVRGRLVACLLPWMWHVLTARARSGLESRRLDQITVAIKESGDVAGMLDYCFDVSQTLVKAIDFRFAVFRLLVDLYMKQEHPNYLNVSRIYVFLDDVDATASLLQQLMSGAEVRLRSCV